MKKPSSMTEQQWQRICSFINSEIIMTPQEFISKWGVNYDFFAALCNCHVRTVNRWFASGRNYSPPLRHHKLALALGDLILSDFKGLPDNFKGYFSLIGIVS